MLWTMNTHHRWPVSWPDPRATWDHAPTRRSNDMIRLAPSLAQFNCRVLVTLLAQTVVGTGAACIESGIEPPAWIFWCNPETCIHRPVANQGQLVYIGRS